MEKKSSHPAWALAFKRKGTELRRINGRYYLYEVTSKWNTEKKRSVKITGKLLGSITEADGFVESEKAQLRKQQIRIERVQVKEYGVTAAIIHLFADIIHALQKFFPASWQRLIVLAYGRLVYQSPLKNMSFHYSGSYLSEEYPFVDMSAKSIGYFLRELGRIVTGLSASAVRSRFRKIASSLTERIYSATPNRWNCQSSVRVNSAHTMT